MFSEDLDVFRVYLWWGTFWVVELTLGTVGILWLAIGAFDRCLGRMPERGTPSSRSPVASPSSSMIVIACALGVIAIWGYGIAVSICPDQEAALRLFDFSVVVLLELLFFSLVALQAALARQRELPGRLPVSAPQNPAG
jgi:hypothetical protein